MRTKRRERSEAESAIQAVSISRVKPVSWILVYPESPCARVSLLTGLRNSSYISSLITGGVAVSSSTEPAPL